MTDAAEKPAVPAATVILLRDVTRPDTAADGTGLQVLMARRNRDLAFVGGHWVFPGGRIDAEDRAGGGDDEAVARRACVREAREEVGLHIDEQSLVGFAHWTAPPEAPRRFATWFFVGAVDEAGATEVDGGEILECLWLSPAIALARHATGDFPLAPPTWIALWQLAKASDAADAMRQSRQRGFEVFSTRMAVRDDVLIALEPGDAGYDTNDPDVPGPRHRLVMDDTAGWRYERTG
ncbi:MAG TPA: NUDIX hydrolase [Mycobacteriales bacterium]|nr:NUDIX hydrolase [Mycobacteriales bacterium]